MGDMNEKIGWFSFTNVLITIAIVISTTQWAYIISIDNKLFSHLTNAELHIPRSNIVEKPQFDLYQKMRDVQLQSMIDMICEIKEMLKENKADNNVRNPVSKMH